MWRVDAWVVRLFVLLAALISLGLLAAGPAVADTQVSSNITSNTTWTATGSPYVLTKSITVSSGVTLSIQPGVTVEFNAGTFGQLSVDGAVSAIGTAGSPVTFMSYQAASGGGAPGQYVGLWVNASASLPSQFSYVDFRYGGDGSGAYYQYGELRVAAGSVGIDHSDFEYNQYSGLQIGTGAASVTVSSSTFSHDGDGIAVVDGSGVLQVSNSTITNNTQDGMFFDVASTSVAGSSVTTSDITQNGRDGIYAEVSCSNPLSTFPHGERNNVYGNGNPLYGADGQELYTLYTCHALPSRLEEQLLGARVPGRVWGHVAEPVVRHRGSFLVPARGLSGVQRSGELDERVAAGAGLLLLVRLGGREDSELF